MPACGGGSLFLPAGEAVYQEHLQIDCTVISEKRLRKNNLYFRINLAATIRGTDGVRSVIIIENNHLLRPISLLWRSSYKSFHIRYAPEPSE